MLGAGVGDCLLHFMELRLQGSNLLFQLRALLAVLYFSLPQNLNQQQQFASVLL